MKDSTSLKDTFKQMSLEGSIAKAYYNLKKKRREIGCSVKDFDKIEMMDNPNAYKVTNKVYSEDNRKKKTEPFYKTNIVNMGNYEELMQFQDKLTEDNKLLVNLFDKLKDRTFTPKSHPISQVPTHRLKQQSAAAYNKTFSSSELWKTPRNILLSTSATFGQFSPHDQDAHKKNIYNKRHLNPVLFHIVKNASSQQTRSELNQKELETYIRAYQTNGFDFVTKPQPQTIDIKHKAARKVNIRKYKDNSKFSYPLINKIIYEKRNKVDVFEKAKENMIKQYEQDRQRP